MSENGWITLAATVANIACTALLIAFARYLAWLAERKTAGKVEEIHKATNSMKDALVEATRSEAHASGIQEERDRKKGNHAG